AVRAHTLQWGPHLVVRIGDELALSSGRLLERREHRVEARGETAELVLPLHVDPLGKVLGLADALSRRRGPSAARATRSPRTAAAAMPPSATRMRNSPTRSSDCSTSVSGRAT